MRPAVLITIAIVLGTLIVLTALLLPAGRESSPVLFDAPGARRVWPLPPSDADSLREAALRRARVWMPPEHAKVDLGANPIDPIPAEVAASRLLTALGFGADRMFLVPRLRCYGCVRTPFYTYWVLDRLRAHGLLARHVPDDRYSDFEWASVERHFEGLTIETSHHRGWAWWELEPIDPSLGASRTERDAL